MPFPDYAQTRFWRNAGAKLPQEKEKIPVYNVLKTTPPLDNSGKKDNSLLLQRLINDFSNYPSPAVFYFPPGTYLFKKPVYLKSGRILRGKSVSETNFITKTSTNAFVVNRFQGQSARVHEASGTLREGDNKLLLKDIRHFAKAKYVEVFVPNDSLNLQEKWQRKWAENLVGMMNEIEHIEGDTLFIKYPAPINFRANKVKIKPAQMIQDVGFENFSLFAANPSMQRHNFFFGHAVNCWIKNIESHYTGKYHVSIEQSLKLSIKDSYFHKAYNYGGGGHGYGVECGYHATKCLIENNILDSLRHSIIVHLGANGNVFAYNYSANPVWPEKGTPPDISVHGHYPYQNLFEGNDVNKISCTDYWGKAGPGNTIFRNRVRGDGILINYADKTIVAGNELISPGAKITINHSKEVVVINNIIGNEIVNPVSSTLPSSLYLAEKPKFFKDKAWPPFGYLNNHNTLPAENRYKKLLNGKKTNIFTKIWNWIKNIF